MSQTFYIHNTTRSPHTRDLRRSLPGPESSTKNIFLSGGLLRVVRGRPSPVTEAFLRRNLREIVEKESKGLLMVYTSTSQRLDLRTLEPIPGSTPPPVLVDEEEPKTAPGVPKLVADLRTDAVTEVVTEAEPTVVTGPAVEEPPVVEEPVVEEAAEEASVSPIAGSEDPAPADETTSTNPFFKGGKKNRR